MRNKQNARPVAPVSPGQKKVRRGRSFFSLPMEQKPSLAAKEQHVRGDLSVPDQDGVYPLGQAAFDALGAEASKNDNRGDAPGAASNEPIPTRPESSTGKSFLPGMPPAERD